MADSSITRRRPARRVAKRSVALVVAVAVAVAGLAASATAQNRFTDVSSTNVHRANIEALESSGVFDGTECGARRFCPDKAAERWAVAVWIVRVVDGRDPVPVEESRFSDVDDNAWWMPYVERLADLQITAGCKTRPLRFCPHETVTRARMATFLVQAFRLQRASSAGFTDTRGNVHEHNIDALFAAGITAGCRTGPLRYCPDSPVSRAQMASLLNSGLDEASSVGTGGGSTPTTTSTPSPGTITLDIEPRSGDTLLAATRGRTCALRRDDTVTCWGGDEGYLEHLSSSGLDRVEAISTGNHGNARLHTCAVHDNGDVSCWGPGSAGQLGQGNTNTYHLPELVSGIFDAVAVAVGPGFTCAVHNRGDVSCWGVNRAGQLGDGTSVSNRDLPTRVRGLRDIVAISAGESHVCAIDDFGDLSCWGWVYDDTPTAVRAPADVISVSMGGTQTCITTEDGRVYCWDFKATTASQMTRIGNITDAVKVAVGDGTACVLHRSGTVSCWGRNGVGQVGDGTTTRRADPVQVGGITDAVDVSVSSGSAEVGPHACVLHQNHSVSCWGGNNLGQLADLTTDNGLTPRRARLLSRVLAAQEPITATELLLDWVESVVDKRRRSFPWLLDAWDHIEQSTSASEFGSDGEILTSCFAIVSSFGCTVTSMTITDISLETVIHYLARVYDLHTGIAPSDSWGPVQLYFATTYPNCEEETDQVGAEVLADTVLHLMVPHAYLPYYEGGQCRGPGRSPTREAEQVVLDGLADRVPAWYLRDIADGLELWEAWLRGPSLPAMANLESEFGGLCSTNWISSPLVPLNFPPAHLDPFRRGGRC